MPNYHSKRSGCFSLLNSPPGVKNYGATVICVLILRTPPAAARASQFCAWANMSSQMTDSSEYDSGDDTSGPDSDDSEPNHVSYSFVPDLVSRTKRVAENSGGNYPTKTRKVSAQGRPAKQNGESQFDTVMSDFAIQQWRSQESQWQPRQLHPSFPTSKLPPPH